MDQNIGEEEARINCADHQEIGADHIGEGVVRMEKEPGVGGCTGE